MSERGEHALEAQRSLQYEHWRDWVRENISLIRTLGDMMTEQLAQPYCWESEDIVDAVLDLMQRIAPVAYSRMQARYLKELEAEHG